MMEAFLEEGVSMNPKELPFAYVDTLCDDAAAAPGATATAAQLQRFGVDIDV